VVIHDDDIDSPLLEHTDLGDRGGPAVDRDDERGLILGKATFQTVVVEAGNRHPSGAGGTDSI